MLLMSPFWSLVVYILATCAAICISFVVILVINYFWFKDARKKDFTKEILAEVDRRIYDNREAVYHQIMDEFFHDIIPPVKDSVTSRVN